MQYKVSSECVPFFPKSFFGGWAVAAASSYVDGGATAANIVGNEAYEEVSGAINYLISDI